MKSRSERQTRRMGRRLGKKLTGGETILLEGELGAGKTHFAKGIAEGLGVKDVVTSPTFSIHNIFQGKKLRLNHFDFYRLASGDEARAMGLDEYFGDGQSVCVVEWGQNAEDILPQKRITVTIEKTEYGREVVIDE